MGNGERTLPDQTPPRQPPPRAGERPQDGAGRLDGKTPARPSGRPGAPHPAPVRPHPASTRNAGNPRPEALGFLSVPEHPSGRLRGPGVIDPIIAFLTHRD